MSAEMDTVIEVDRLQKSYKQTKAVEDVSFEVRRGEIFGLAGPNGAGKTTTVECLQGLRRPDSGRIRVLGLDPQKQTQELRQRIGCQLQQSALHDRIKVWEALDLFAAFSAVEVDWRGLMHQWGLAEKANSPFASLSGGQRQRLFVALALVNRPEVVFLDEMTAGLDPAARRATWELIRSVREHGATVVLVTHFMDEAHHLCDRVAIINRGRVAALDTPSNLATRARRRTFVLFSSDEPDLSWIESVPNVTAVHRQGNQVRVEGSGPILALVAAALVQRNIVPPDLRVELPSLEDAYLEITGSKWQD